MTTSPHCLATGRMIRPEMSVVDYLRQRFRSLLEDTLVQQRLLVDIDRLALCEPTQQRLSLVQQERAEASQQFFAANATKFREHQDLIARFSVYADHVQTLFSRACGDQHMSVLEVGPGEGELLPALSQQFTQVVALDNSAIMLQSAQNLATKQQLKNIQFHLGDTKLLARENICTDCIVINMVLHHTPEPPDIFFDLAQALNPRGVLVITDLCSHQQQWARESCGDLWLGFEPQDFSDWAQAAGLGEGQSEYFALRNGFQVQIRQFIKP